jgi:hypothetical protein
METIEERKVKTPPNDDDEDPLTRLLQTSLKISNPTESIGHRNVIHRRVQSTTLFSILDSPSNMRHRVRSLSLAEAPSLDKYYPGSHLVDTGNTVVDSCNGNNPIYLSLWLLPPMPLRQKLLKDIAKLAMRYSPQGSSAPFMPHVTINGSIACGTVREANELGQKLQKGLEASGGVPCRFDRSNGCRPMYKHEDGTNRLVWSQSCIAIMERSDEFMNLLELSRKVLELPSGECTYLPFSLERQCTSVCNKLTTSFSLSYAIRDVSGANMRATFQVGHNRKLYEKSVLFTSVY